MNILMVDDDLTFSLQLRKDIELMFKSPRVEIKTEDFLNVSLEEIDVGFFDIDLKSANGIKIAQQLKLRYPNMLVVFVSSREEFVFNTFVLDVFQFIRKAKYNQDVGLVLNQLKQHLEKNQKKKVYTIKGRKVVIRPERIKYIVSIGHDIVVSEDEDYTFRSTIKTILEDFDVPYLVQIQKNMVINFNFVKSLKRTKVITLDDKEYNVGRSYQQSLISQYEAFLLE